MSLIKRMLFATIFSVAVICAQAATEIVDGIEWTYTVSSGKARIGGGSSSSPAVPKSTSGAITIPSTLGGYPVTSIGSSALRGCSSLTSITIPDGVTSIGDRAFSSCSSLTSVTIGDSVTSIGHNAFYGCNSLTSITIPDGVTSIGDRAFYDCSSLTNIMIGAAVESIGEYAFRYCTSLPSISIPDSVKRIGLRAFNNCSKLLFDSKTIPGAKMIDGWVIMSNSNVKDLNLIGIKGIVDQAFESCVSLTNLAISGSLETTGYAAFRQCNSLVNVKILNNVKCIASESFYGCPSLVNVEIADSVTEIGQSAFENCVSLESIIIPSSVSNISRNAFSNCYSLKRIFILGNAPNIGGDSIENLPFYGVDEQCTVYVMRDSTGWGVKIPGEWNGIKIEYAPYTISEFLGGKWIEGMVGMGDIELVEDITTKNGMSVKFMAEDSSSVWIETTVTNQGKVLFNWKVSSEAFKYYQIDYASFSIDGKERAWIGGEVDWTNQMFIVEGEGPHVLRWTYTKDLSDKAGEDCAWLSDVVWIPILDSIPELDESATADEVANVLSRAADEKLMENIKTATEYAEYRDWALGLEGVAPAQVMISPNAWLSYALNTDKLIEGEVTESRLKIVSFKRAEPNGSYSIKLTLDGVDIGDGVIVENLLKTFAIEGANEFNNDLFSVMNVVVMNVVLDVVNSHDGTVEFIVSPLVNNTSFFYRVRMRDAYNGIGMNRFTPQRDKVQLWKDGPYWATTNIGAENPWESGYYFWWGDTIGYKRENDKWVASDCPVL